MTEQKTIRILHVITGLGTGGAEMMMLKLINSLKFQTNTKVVVLMGKGSLSTEFESLGIDVTYLRISPGGLPSVGAIAHLINISRNFRPDVIQGWMYHGNLAAWLVKKLSPGRTKLVWNVRQSLYALSFESIMTRWIVRLTSFLSSSPDKIIYNSKLSAQQHEEFGYSKKSRALIPNGFNLESFKPDRAARESVFKEFCLDSNAPLVIHAARYHPMKDHATLLVAAKRVLERCPDANFLLVGKNVTIANPKLNLIRTDLCLENRVILAGKRSDLPRLFAAADMVVLSSAWGEGFPNVIGEAMACGKPCVVTDVGDSANVLGDTGYVVPPRDADALSSKIVELMPDKSRLEILGANARRRVEESFSIERIAQMYLDLYQEDIA